VERRSVGMLVGGIVLDVVALTLLIVALWSGRSSHLQMVSRVSAHQRSRG
jgi:hypothetical protein